MFETLRSELFIILEYFSSLERANILYWKIFFFIDNEFALVTSCACEWRREFVGVFFIISRVAKGLEDEEFFLMLVEASMLEDPMKPK